MARKTSSSNDRVTTNAQDIGYVLGKMEMIEKKFDEHRAESQLEKQVIINKLEEITKTMSFWRHTLWLFKVIGLSIPLILAGNFSSVADLWKSL